MLLGLSACASLVGLDDLHERAAPALTTEASTDASSDTKQDVDASTGHACASSAQCTGAGPSLCVAGKCVAIDTTICSVIPEGIVEREDSFFVAAFVPILGPTPPEDLIMRLALEELQASGGLPVGGGSRTMGMVLCDSDPSNIERSFNHVMEDLHVPALIAGFDAQGLADYSQRAADKGVFVLNPGVTPETVKYKTTLNRYLWGLLGTPNDMALAYRPLLERAEPYARKMRDAGGAADGGADSGEEPLRVVILKTTDTSTEEAIATVLTEGSAVAGSSNRDESKALFFNDASAPKNILGQTLTTIPVPAYENKKTPDIDTIAAQLLSKRPDVVIALTQEEVGPILDRLEVQDPTFKPVWLLGPRNARGPLDHMKKEPDPKRKRFLGVQYAGTTAPAQREKWLQRMHGRWDGDRIPEAAYASRENYYDAVYWLAFGLVAAGAGAPIEGASFRDGVRNLTSGNVEVNPGLPDDQLGFAIPFIQAGTARYVGALGPPDINLQFGVWNSVGAVYCYDHSPDGGAIEPRYDTLRYNRADGKLEPPDSGVFDCIIGF